MPFFRGLVSDQGPRTYPSELRGSMCFNTFSFKFHLLTLHRLHGRRLNSSLEPRYLNPYVAESARRPAQRGVFEEAPEVYLLSSPTGPQAVLLVDGAGSY
jgi:hypothetical protein